MHFRPSVTAIAITSSSIMAIIIIIGNVLIMAMANIFIKARGLGPQKLSPVCAYWGHAGAAGMSIIRVELTSEDPTTTILYIIIASRILWPPNAWSTNKITQA